MTAMPQMNLDNKQVETIMKAAALSTASVKQIAESIAALPPLPSTAQEILTCFGDEFIDADKVSTVVEGDPGICAKLLGLSNSAYFGLAEPVGNIRDAISRVLGVDTVRSLVLAMAIQRSFNSKNCPGFDAERFWMFSLLTSECCKKLAAADDKASDAVRDLASSTGLCHNLGLMALAHMEPERTSSILIAQRSDPDPANLKQRFLSAFEFDHRMMTAELTRNWSLPELMVNAFEFRALGSTSGDDRLGRIVTAATAAISNVDREEDDQIDLGPLAEPFDMTGEELLEIATFSERQQERVKSLSSSMA